MRRIVFKHGLLAGLIMAASLAIVLPFSDRLGFTGGAVVSYATMVAAFLLVFSGVRAYRDEVAGGVLGFGRALGVGALIVLVASAVYTAAWEVVYYTALPDFAAQYAAHELAKLTAAGATAAQLAAKRAELARFAENYRNPLYNVAMTMLEPLPVGLAMALVAAGVLRRRPAGGRAAPVGLARAA